MHNNIYKTRSLRTHSEHVFVNESYRNRSLCNLGRAKKNVNNNLCQKKKLNTYSGLASLI